MKIGQTIYLGPARLEAVYHGTAKDGRIKARHSGRQLLVKPEIVRQRSEFPAVRSPFTVGQIVTVTIGGIAREFDAEVIQIGPVKARIRTPDPVWFGAVVDGKNGKIWRQE